MQYIFFYFLVYRRNCGNTCDIRLTNICQVASLFGFALLCCGNNHSLTKRQKFNASSYSQYRPQKLRPCISKMALPLRLVNVRSVSSLPDYQIASLNWLEHCHLGAIKPRLWIFFKFYRQTAARHKQHNVSKIVPQGINIQSAANNQLVHLPCKQNNIKYVWAARYVVRIS